MARQITQPVLERENDDFRGSGGVSQENRCYGFRPAFFDTETQHAYPSCFPDGRPAPFHLIEGLPDEIVDERDACGHVCRIKDSVVAGFLLAEQFYTRAEAAELVETMH